MAVRQFVPHLGHAARYEILRSCLNELSTAGLIVPTPHVSPTGPRTTIPGLATSSGDAQSSPSEHVREESVRTDLDAFSLSSRESAVRLPGWIALSALLIVMDPTDPASRLHALSQNCASISGRSLHKLPLMALTMYTYSQTCDMDEAISALQAAFNDELDGINKMSIGD